MLGHCTQPRVEPGSYRPRTLLGWRLTTKTHVLAPCVTDERERYLYPSTVLLRKSMKQHCTALSSTKVEEASLSEPGREVKWMGELLTELEAVQKLIATMDQKNTGSIDCAAHIGQSRLNKHINVRFHHVSWLGKHDTAESKFIKTFFMLANILTNSLHGPKPKFVIHRLRVAK